MERRVSMGEVIVIGLGASDFDQLPFGVYKKLQSAEKVVVRTEQHPVVQSLKEEGIQFESFDEIYEKHDTFEPVYKEIAQTIINRSREQVVVYAVPGHPLVAEQSVQYLLEAHRNGEVSVTIEGGQSFLDAIFTTLQIDPIDGFQLIDGTNFSTDDVNMRQHVLIAQVYDAFSASEVKLTLMEKYQDDYKIKVVTAAGSEQEAVLEIPLYELDHVTQLNNLTTIYVPPVKTDEEALADWTTFRRIIATLRGPNGCPWDQKQTHESLKKYMLEEVHEFLAAVDAKDDFGMVEELGDVLLQVFLHAQIGQDNDYFNLEEILTSISGKMIRRHPHVFKQQTVEDAEDVVRNWEEIKRTEKGERQNERLLTEQYRPQSALQTAYNYQKKAATVGFDWPSVEQAWAKFEEEWQEFREEIQNGSDETRIDEFGDVLFTLINVARFYKISPEEAMWHANQKFANRFNYVEQQVQQSGRPFEQFTLKQLDYFWDEAKKLEKDNGL